MQSSLSEQPKRNKTPQEFLGANSGLVNLDELVKPDQTSKKGKLLIKIFVCFVDSVFSLWSLQSLVCLTHFTCSHFGSGNKKSFLNDFFSINYDTSVKYCAI